MTPSPTEPVGRLKRPTNPRKIVGPPPGGALSIGGLPALVHSVHLMSLAIDAVRYRIGEQLHLNAVDVTALIEVYNRPNIRPSELGRTLHMGSAGLTALADRLVRAGYLDRSPDPSDRRASCLRLTPAGTHAAGWIFDGVSTALADHIDEVHRDDDATATTLHMCEALNHAFE